MRKTEAYQEAHIHAARLSALTGFPVLIHAHPQIATHDGWPFPDEPARRVSIGWPDINGEPRLIRESDRRPWYGRVIVPIVYDGGSGATRWHVRLAVALATDIAQHGRPEMAGYTFGRTFLNEPARDLRTRFGVVEDAMRSINVFSIVTAARKVTTARDTCADSGAYPAAPDGPDPDSQGFDDWAADLLDRALTSGHG